jgi:hypothetical protein
VTSWAIRLPKLWPTNTTWRQVLALEIAGGVGGEGLVVEVGRKLGGALADAAKGQARAS